MADGIIMFHKEQFFMAGAESAGFFVLVGLRIGGRDVFFHTNLTLKIRKSISLHILFPHFHRYILFSSLHRYFTKIEYVLNG